MTLAGRCDRVLTLIDEVLDAGGATMADASAADGSSLSGAPSDLPSVERAMIQNALQQARFNKSIAAKALGLTRAQLYTRLKRHGLD